MDAFVIEVLFSKNGNLVFKLNWRVIYIIYLIKYTCYPGLKNIELLQVNS